jgi:hypothetical protein
LMEANGASVQWQRPYGLGEKTPEVGIHLTS